MAIAITAIAFSSCPPGQVQCYRLRHQWEGLCRVGYGKDANGNAGWFSDWWEYDPATNTWTKKAAFPGGKGYVCSGEKHSGGVNTWQNDLISGADNKTF